MTTLFKESSSWPKANYEADQSHFSTPKDNQIIAQKMYLCGISTRKEDWWSWLGFKKSKQGGKASIYKVLRGGCHLHSKHQKLWTGQTSRQFTPHYTQRQAAILPTLHRKENFRLRKSSAQGYLR